MIFVDTGAWIAILNPNDQYHREAVAVYRPFQQLSFHPQFSHTALFNPESNTHLV